MSLDTNLQKVDANQQYESNNTTEPNIAVHSLQSILANFKNYRPKSNIIDFKKLESSPYLKLKKYKDAAYYGEIVNGKRSGFGVIVHNNNRIYQGQWQCDFKNGKGYQQLQNGCIFQGFYVNGKPQGLGKYQWPNGEFYEGEWLNGLKHGFGTWHGVKGDKYVGQWKFGKADGQGVHVWINGDRYEGQFKQCLKHGKGTQKFSNGDLYTGQFYKGKSHGYGEYYWANGSYYKGNFQKGKRNGHGIWKRTIGNSDKYEGEYIQDRKQGYGIFTWYAGNIYKGNYHNDEREGYGEMFWTDGSYYKGQWHKGVQQGQGIIYTVQQGEKKGVFHNNIMTQIMIEEQDQFSVPVKPKRVIPKQKNTNSHNNNSNRMTQIQQRNRFHINSHIKKYTSLQLKGNSKNKLKQFVKDNIMNRTYSRGSNKRTFVSSKKEDQFPKSVLKKEKVKNIQPLPQRKRYTVPYESIYTHKLENSIEEDTTKLLQTNAHKTKPFKIDFSERLNNSTVL